jgi:hypothetical protein
MISREKDADSAGVSSTSGAVPPRSCTLSNSTTGVIANLGVSRIAAAIASATCAGESVGVKATRWLPDVTLPPLSNSKVTGAFRPSANTKVCWSARPAPPAPPTRNVWTSPNSVITESSKLELVSRSAMVSALKVPAVST